MGVEPHDTVLDLCAAPGGKTAALLRAAQGGLVVASDIHVHRLRAARAQFTRLHVDQARLIALDAEKDLPFRAQFQRVLIDAPCSGTGTLARHPEIRWRLTSSHLSDFHRLQSAILRNAAAHVQGGGRFLYSTCSLEPDENEAVVEDFLRDANGAGFRRINKEQMVCELRPHLADGVDAAALFGEDGFFRTSPAQDGTDGFFAAALERA
jgi:16S rRNA (cytosine967-C5)-methyltransferase